MQRSHLRQNSVTVSTGWIKHRSSVKVHWCGSSIIRWPLQDVFLTCFSAWEPQRGLRLQSLHANDACCLRSLSSHGTQRGRPTLPATRTPFTSCRPPSEIGFEAAASEHTHGQLSWSCRSRPTPIMRDLVTFWHLLQITDRSSSAVLDSR